MPSMDDRTSPLAQVYLPHAAMTVKMGRVAPPEGEPKLRLSKYLSSTLPDPPASIDYTPAAAKSLASIHMNNRLGCCVVSGGCHVLETMLGNAGTPFLATDQQVVHDYSAIGGYNGTPWTDRGCNETQALNYWTKTGFASGHKLLGWAAIDATNIRLVKQALWLFENVLFGVAMPNQWVGRDMPQSNGFTWDVAGRANGGNGHCFSGVGFDAKGVKIDTWGLLGTLTWEAVSQYAVPGQGGELYVMFSEAMLIAANKRSPAGLDVAALIEDMDQFGATIASRTPDPVPPPPSPPDDDETTGRRGYSPPPGLTRRTPE